MIFLFISFSPVNSSHVSLFRFACIRLSIRISLPIFANCISSGFSKGFVLILSVPVPINFLEISSVPMPVL